MQPIEKQGMLFPWLALQQERDTSDTAQCKAQHTPSLWPTDRNAALTTWPFAAMLRLPCNPLA